MTRKEIEFEKRKREVYTQVKIFAHDFSREEWKDRSIYKFYPYYDCEDEALRISFDTFLIDNRLYFKSREDIKKAIEAVGEKDFIKYYLGVKE